MRLVLASTSPWRKMLLSRLRIPFEALAPEVVEVPLPGEAPWDFARRMAKAKAEDVASKSAGPEDLVIGADQVLALGNRILPKPESIDAARTLLHTLSGQEAVFYTGLMLCDGQGERLFEHLATTRLGYRRLSIEAIEGYLEKEDAVGCAGAIKTESLGIALCERIEGDDPTAVVGLPLLALVTFLQEAGVDVLAAEKNFTGPMGSI